ncbi:hypothetical protein MMC26_003802 [Xylographa opegraphella]|nr:hypothetical protein [Xylographa opegraphella]
MDEHDRTSEVWSLRSRASSVVSTGTKMSIGTLANPSHLPESPPPECSQTAGIDVLLGLRNFRITARPGSVLSISSFDHPAPPYDAQPPPGTGHTTLDLSEFETPEPPPTRSQVERALEPDLTSPPFRSSRSARSVHFASPIHSPSPSHSPPPSPSFSPTLPSPPTLSQHYTHVVRTIDANHRAEIASLTATHAAAVAAIEARHKAATDAIEDRHRAESVSHAARMKAGEELHAAHLAQERATWAAEVGRARNEVEEMWEARWSETMRVTGGEMERLRVRVRELELQLEVANGRRVA